MVTKDTSVYVDITTLTPGLKKELNAPVCCENTTPFCSMLMSCVSFTFVMPLIFYLISLSSDVLTANSLQTISIVLLIIGTLYCCCSDVFPVAYQGRRCMYAKRPGNHLHLGQ